MWNDLKKNNLFSVFGGGGKIVFGNNVLKFPLFYKSLNHNTVYRPAPSTPGLLKRPAEASNQMKGWRKNTLLWLKLTTSIHVLTTVVRKAPWLLEPMMYTVQNSTAATGLAPLGAVEDGWRRGLEEGAGGGVWRRGAGWLKVLRTCVSFLCIGLLHTHKKNSRAKKN